MNRAWLVLAATLTVAGCAGPGHVQYDGGRCLKDGAPIALDAVEASEAEVARRIASRQPWFAVITITIVLLAAAGNAEKVLLLMRARHADGHRPFAERLRDALVRQREKPALFATIVGGSLALIAIAGASYVYLDVDKRASERALAMLQFCHLALRTQEEKSVLDAQRSNLMSIQSTAGDIRDLVSKLPPDEQRKAQLIVNQMNLALTKQGKLVGDYVARTDEAQKDLNVRTTAMEKGIASVAGELSELRALPSDLRDLQGSARKIGEATTGIDSRLEALRAQIATEDTKLEALLSRPACASAGTTTSAGSASPSFPVAGTALHDGGSRDATPPAMHSPPSPSKAPANAKSDPHAALDGGTGARAPMR